MAGISETRTWDAVLTTTLAKYRKKMYDQIFDYNPFLSWLNGSYGEGLVKTKQRKNDSVKRIDDGGESIVEHLMYGKTTSSSSYSGAETFNTSLQDGMTIARYNWKQYGDTINITGLDRRNNSGDAAMINLLKAKTNQSTMSLRDRLSIDAFADGTGNGSKNLTGLAAIVSTTTTLGGINPSTYAWWKPTTSAVGSWAADGRNKLRKVFNTISFGSNAPDIAFTDQTSFEYIQASEESKERYMIGDSKSLELGVQAVLYNGMPIVFDRDCTSGTLYLLNSKYLSFVVHKDADMEISPFVTPDNQDVSTAKIIFQGNITCSSRRHFGSLTGITQ